MRLGIFGLGVVCLSAGLWWGREPPPAVVLEVAPCYNGATSAVDAGKKTPYEPEEKTCP